MRAPTDTPCGVIIKAENPYVININAKCKNIVLIKNELRLVSSGGISKLANPKMLNNYLSEDSVQKLLPSGHDRTFHHHLLYWGEGFQAIQY